MAEVAGVTGDCGTEEIATSITPTGDFLELVIQ